MDHTTLLTALARCFTSGDSSAEALAARASRMLGREWRWLLPLARRVLRFQRGRVRLPVREVIGFLRGDLVLASQLRRLEIAHWIGEEPVMRPVPAAARWALPEIVTPGGLAEWLNVAQNDLDWFVRMPGHYHYRLLRKRAGGVRLIEAPKPRLKAVQRRILAGILDLVPAHRAAHGFRRGRSTLTFAGPHAGRPLLLRLDLSDFFPSIPAARIGAVFRTLGYPEDVARLLAGLCTTSTPAAVWGACLPVERGEGRQVYDPRHLPQGAPTSPALANLCVYRADCRLAALARRFGGEYTRYGDDLAFSFAAAMDTRMFAAYAAAILMEEGFAVNYRKTRVRRAAESQRLAGLVTNVRPALPREEFDRLKATLTNCARLGPAGQNRSGVNDFRAHLEGRVGYVESIQPERGRRLRAIFDKIAW